MQLSIQNCGAVILAGGRSRRMGTCKALLKIHGETMLTRLAGQLELFDERLLSANDPGLSGEVSFPAVADVFQGAGPLGGLHAALSAVKKEALFCVPCDLPNFTSEMPMLLMEYFPEKTDAFVCRDGSGRIHPLCGVYTKQALPVIEKQLVCGEYRMTDLLRKLRCVYFDTAAFLPDHVFYNMNTQDEFARCMWVEIDIEVIVLGLYEELLFLNEQDVLSLLTPADAIAAAEDTFLHIGLGDITVGEMALMYVDKEKKNNFHSMPAILHHKHAAGVKWIDTYANPIPGYPFSHGNLVLLSDTHTGSPIAIVGATNITTMRTAGGHGVVQAKHLCNPDPAVLTVIGCGAQAKAGIQGFLTHFSSLKQIRLYNRSRAPMMQVKQELSDRVEVVLCDSPSKAVKDSNLILMSSGAYQPLVTLDMIRPGTTIIGIEGFRDLDPRIGKRAEKWYLGYKKPDAYILKSPNLNPGGFLADQDVFGDMTELLTDRIPGREREDEVIVSTHMGMGAHDVNCAVMVYERARQKGMGQMLVLSSTAVIQQRTVSEEII